MSEESRPNDAGNDEIAFADVPTVAPPDPFANLPKPRHGFEIRGPDDPMPEPDDAPSPRERDVSPERSEP